MAPPSMTRVTIGMPVYNGAAYIEQAIAAIEAQTYTDFTVIAADNVSTDGSWEILQAWAARDRRVILHRHDENIGALANFRYVLDHAETPYFMWHAVDDWMSPSYLSALCPILDAAPTCALACADVTRVLIDGSPKPRKATQSFPDLAGLSRRRRIMAMLRSREAVWLYGLFRSDHIRRVQRDVADFGYAWSADRLMLLPFMLDDAVRGSPEAHFYSRATGASSQLYMPSSFPARIRFLTRYFAVSLRIYQTSGLSRLDKLVLFPSLLWHATRTCHSGFYKFYIKWPFKMLTGRIKQR